MAPLAARGEVFVIISAAVLQRDDVVSVPIVGRAQLSLALVATTVCGLEYPGSALWRHVATLGVLKAGSGHGVPHFRSASATSRSRTIRR